MKFFVFRNTTTEQLFTPAAQTLGGEVSYSGYEDISFVDLDADCFVWWYLAPYKAEEEQAAAEIEHYGSLLALVLQQIPATKSVIALTIEPLFEAGCLTNRSAIEQAAERYNNVLWDLAQVHPQLKVFDFSTFTRQFALGQLVDWKYYFISQIPLNPRLSKEFAAWLAGQYHAAVGQRKKCLVLDLDNTLWGGVLGEEGVHGIKVGADYPGNAYQYFQRYILQMQRQGVILALCSKNNLADVEQVWHHNTNNLIGKEHISAYRINWQDKATNIKELAAELNIGLDSMVFVDDNPTERELVRGMLPMVAVPDFVAQPYELPKLAQQLAYDYFRTYGLTNEDLAKTEQYQANAERAKAQSTFGNFDDYIRSLEIELSIEPVSAATLERAAQMTQKTNQFNLTTKRYTEAALRQLLDQGAQMWTLGVTDKFGASGITGLLIATVEADRATIDTLLLSCRVLGKGIEKVFLTECLAQLALGGVTTLLAEYIPTAKNGQVSDFYEQLNFSKVAEHRYALDLRNYAYPQNNLYKIR